MTFLNLFHVGATGPATIARLLLVPRPFSLARAQQSSCSTSSDEEEEEKKKEREPPQQQRRPLPQCRRRPPRPLPIPSEPALVQDFLPPQLIHSLALCVLSAFFCSSLSQGSAPLIPSLLSFSFGALLSPNFDLGLSLALLPPSGVELLEFYECLVSLSTSTLLVLSYYSLEREAFLSTMLLSLSAALGFQSASRAPRLIAGGVKGARSALRELRERGGLLWVKTGRKCLDEIEARIVEAFLVATMGVGGVVM
jgi:hypothetical protein